MSELSEALKASDLSNLPNIDSLDTPLDLGLWILLATKENLGVNKLTAREIAELVVEVLEKSADYRMIVAAFNRAGRKIHVYHESGIISYEIMNPGKDYLFQKIKVDSIQVHYFEPGRRYSSKTILCEKILSELKGELRVVDPYCGLSTLDVLLRAKTKKAKILTCIDNLRGNQKGLFMRGLQDFMSDCKTIEFKNYSSSDIHDRYILADDQIVLLGQSIKDLGNKESFAIILVKDAFADIYKNLFTVFDKRWNQATLIP